MKTAAIIGMRLDDGTTDYSLIVRGEVVARFATLAEAANACDFARHAEQMTIKNACTIMRAICKGEWEK